MTKQYAIIHKATRVITGLTVDSKHDPGEDKQLVALPRNIDDLGAIHPAVLNPDKTIRPATPEEVDAADADPERHEARMKKRKEDRMEAIKLIIDDPAVPASVKAYFRIMISG